MKKTEKRQAILKAANRLFETQGFNGTGVDQIALESGVTKRTLYKHFGSKEGLIASVLKTHHEAMLNSMRETINKLDADPAERLLAMFDYYGQWFASPTFSGCIFIKTLNEFSTCSTELCRIARNAKEDVRHFLLELSHRAGVGDPESLASQLQILLEGSILISQYRASPAVSKHAKLIAAECIKKALPG